MKVCLSLHRILAQNSSCYFDMNTYSHHLVEILFVLLITLYITHVNANAIQGRIISGIPAKEGQFPWQVLIKKDDYDTLRCSGSIIFNIWVVTAGHCTYGVSSLQLEFGSIYRENNTNSITSTEFFIHPQYNPATLANDISLIKLPTPLVYTETIQPISLDNSPQTLNSLVGSTAIIAGFGITDDEYLDYSDILLWADVQIITNSDCAKVYGAKVISDTNICSKGEGNTNKSICSGDSGGPLIAIKNNTATQIGINSFVAEDKCTEGYPSVYVRISKYLPFISNVTELNFN